MKIFKDEEINPNQKLLLPPCIDDFLPEDSSVRMISEIIEQMNLEELIQKYRGGGAPAYHPEIMLKIIVLGYCLGVRSSRKLASLLDFDIRFMFLSRMSKPDFRTIALFRRNNQEAIRQAFRETVRLSIEMGLVNMEHVSLDGSKLEANVSRRELCNTKNTDKLIEEIDRKITVLLEESEKTDAEEDGLYGNRRGDELPEKLKKHSDRKKRIKQAKEEMEKTGRKLLGATDLESRVMMTQSGKRAAYNAQAVVDREHQVIVAAEVSQSENDSGEFIPMLEQTLNNTGRMPEKIFADGGYHSQENLQYAKDKRLDAYIPERNKNKITFKYDSKKDMYICPEGKALKYHRTGYNRHKKLYRIYRCKECDGCPLVRICQGTGRDPGKRRDLFIRADVDRDLREEMQKKMSSSDGKLLYGLRMHMVEPVFGNIKFNMNFRKLLLRGLNGARIEYLLGCIAHNIKKIMRFRIEWKKLVPA